MASFRQAAALGVDALEMDVHLTADGEVVVHHDPTVDRCTDGRGPIADRTWAELSALDAGARFTRDGRTFPFRGAGVRIPRFVEVLEAFPAMPLLVDPKVPAAAAPLRRLIEAAGAEDRCHVAGFDGRAVLPFAGSRVAIGACAPDLWRLLPRAFARRPPVAMAYRFIAMPFRYRGLPLPMAGFVRVAAAHGVPIHAWTVDDERDATRLWDLGVRGLITNEPARLIALRARLETAEAPGSEAPGGEGSGAGGRR